MDHKEIKKKTFSGLIYRFGERILAQLVSTIVSIVLARILMPEDYGIISLVTVLITILNVLVTNGLGTALIQKKESDELDFSTIFWASGLLSLLLYALLFFFAPLIANVYENALLTPILRVMGIRIPFAAINSVQQAYVSKKFMFKKFFWATLTGTLVSGVIGIVMALRGFGVWALVFQYLTNVCIDTVFLYFTVRWRPRFLFSFSRFKQLFSFGWKILVGGLVTTIYEELRSLIIAGKYSTADLSYYTKGQQFPKLLSNNVATTITNVMFPVLSLYQDDKEGLKRAVRKSMQTCAYAMFPMLFGFAAVAETFVRVILTDKWLPAVPYIYIFCIFYMLKPLKTINQSCVKALGRSGLDLAMNFIEKGVGILLIVVSMHFGVIYLAASAVVTYILSALMEMIANRFLIRYSFREQIGDIIAPLLLSCLMAIVVYLLGKTELNMYLLLVLQVLAGGLIYWLFSALFRLKSYRYLFGIVRGKLKK